MKILMIPLLCSLLLGTTFKATASDPCDRVQQSASAIMKARQTGVEAHVVVNLYRDGVTEGDFNIYMKIIMDAYRQMKYETELYQDKATKEFANKYYMMCWSYRV